MRVLAERNRNIQHAETIKQSHQHQPRKPSASLSSIAVFGGGNTLISVDCADDIFKYMRYLEKQDALSPNFLDAAEGRIDGRMRQILVDWLIHVQRRFDFLNETLSLAVWMLDRALLNMKMSKSNLQLLGVACIFVAAKYEEIVVPNIQDFVYVSADVFTKKDVLSMEQQVLKAVGFRCNITHAIQFLRRFRHCLLAPRELHNLAKFICDVGLVAYSLAHHVPSVIAAVSIYLSAYILEYTIPAKLLKTVVDISQDKLEEVAREFVPHVLQLSNPEWKLYALREKHQKDTLIPFTDVQIKRLNKLIK